MIYYLLIGFIIILDQSSKFLVVKFLPLHAQKNIIPNVLSLTHIHNAGAAWGIFENQMIFFYILTLAVIIFLTFWLHTEGKQNLWTGLSISFIIGGAMGNFIDRLLHQYVIDMVQLDFINFPIFNVADMALTIGVVMLLVHTLFSQEELM